MKEKIIEHFNAIGLMIAFLKECAVENRQNTRKDIKTFLDYMLNSYYKLRSDLLAFLESPEVALKHDEKRN